MLTLQETRRLCFHINFWMFLSINSIITNHILSGATKAPRSCSMIIPKDIWVRKAMNKLIMSLFSWKHLTKKCQKFSKWTNSQPILWYSHHQRYIKCQLSSRIQLKSKSISFRASVKKNLYSLHLTVFTPLNHY